jgi:hypothetical protein
VTLTHFYCGSLNSSVNISSYFFALQDYSFSASNSLFFEDILSIAPPLNSRIYVLKIGKSTAAYMISTASLFCSLYSLKFFLKFL